MHITFDHGKDQINVEKHGVSLSAAADFEWDDALVSADERRNYGEARMIAIGYIGRAPVRSRVRQVATTANASLACTKQTQGRQDTMPKLKPGTILPTPEEDAAIIAVALSDPDAQPLTNSELGQFKPARRLGRPPAEFRKVPTSIRIDARVVDAFKATGNGWQTRMNDALLEYAQQHGTLAQ